MREKKKGREKEIINKKFGALNLQRKVDFIFKLNLKNKFDTSPLMLIHEAFSNVM